MSTSFVPRSGQIWAPLAAARRPSGMTANGAPDVVEVMSDSDSDSDDIMVMEDVSWVKLGKKVDARAVIERVRREAGATEAGAARDARMEAAARAAAA
eukprot:31388-Pelagococcus_subviridis.AAC.19